MPPNVESILSADTGALQHDYVLADRLLRIWNVHPSEMVETPTSEPEFQCHGSERFGHGSGGPALGKPPESRIYPHGAIRSKDPSKDQGIAITDYCGALIEAAADETHHFFRLDSLYGKLVGGVLKTTKAPSADQALVQAGTLLARLPPTPVEFRPKGFSGSHIHELPQPYFSQSSSKPRSWEDLVVVSNFSSNTLRLALADGCRDFVAFDPNVERLVDTTADLLEEVGHIQGQVKGSDRRGHVFVVQAFLWCSWQRLSMLMLLQALRRHLVKGFRQSDNDFWSMRGNLIASSVFEQSGEGNPTELPAYMCPWAFRSLCVEKSAATFDFRRFKQRFQSYFGLRQPRCLPGQKQCGGKAATSCQRLKGAVIVDQSAHAKNCPGTHLGCKRLYWDKDSYLAVQGGARCVCIASSHSELRYRCLSDRTMAISHVWSHGQGGRPEQNPDNQSQGGMNSCLHRRYAELAIQEGCDSYWMDTACIPQDHALRREAIETINSVFEGARITLVCDKDLMEMDVGCLVTHDWQTPACLQVLETLLATLLVSDWNVRAWTLLEAARGRNNIHLLCASNVTVSLFKAVDTVSRYGAIDIAILYVTAHQLLPPPKDEIRVRLTLENSSALLSRRHASREGDIVVIWSLLFGNVPFYTPEDMWKTLMRRRRDVFFGCGFLMTKAPRVQGIEGLSWAPQAPALISLADEEPGGQQAHLGEAAVHINVCTMEEKGLSWWCCAHRFNCTAASRTSGQLGEISTLYLGGDGQAALLVPSFVGRSANLDFPASCLPASFKGNRGGTMMAVCRLRSKFVAEWRGVYEWMDSEPVPKLLPQHFFLR